MRKPLQIAAASDLHGELGIQFPECDIGILNGDIVPLMSSAEDWHQWQELNWVERKLLRWMKRQPVGKWIVSWGNHDIVSYSPDTRPLVTEMLEGIDAVVLDDSYPWTVQGGWKFSGFPYTPTIQDRNWAFSLPRGDERVKMCVDHHIESDTDVLISHGPPQGFLDGENGDRFGCAILHCKIVEVCPRVVFTGHIHGARGKRDKMFGSDGKYIKLINTSIVDPSYSPKGGKVQQYKLIERHPTWEN